MWWINRRIWLGATVAVGVVLYGVVGRPAAPPALEWWKGNLHTHTLWSDGDDFPEMVALWYREQGYHFLALSDHNVLSEGVRWMKQSDVKRRGGEAAMEKYLRALGPSWVEQRGEGEAAEVRLKPLTEIRPLVEERGRFLMIQGEEITDHFENLPVHLNATHLAALIPPQGGVSVREVIANNLRAVRDQAEATGRPILVHLNHPNFVWGVTAQDIAAVTEERFFEVYNGHPSVHHLGDGEHPSVERIWDIVNTLRIVQQEAPLYGLATDDSHNYHGGNVSPGRGWVMVRADRLTPEKLLAAIQRGDFYASSGVELLEVRYDAEEGVLEVEIRAGGSATFTTRFIGTLAGPPAREPGEVLAEVQGTRVSYRFNGNELYVRAVITSSVDHPNPSFAGQKQQAWTQPVGWKKRLK